MKRAISLALLLSASAWAQAPTEFYKGRTVELYIGYSVGGGYDIYARLLARHMARHMPGNPVIAPKNMPGAGSLTLANWLYAAAPRDGSVFGTIGTKMKLVTGYPGGNDITLAMQRGEVEARCGWSWSSIKSGHAQWVKDGTIKLLVQLSLGKHPDLPDVPLIMDLVKTPEQRAILRLVFARQVMGRPFLAPPGLRPERLALLRRAFMETMKDPAFLAEAEKIQLEITPVDGEAVQKLVAEIYATPPDIVRKAADAVK